MSELPEPPDEPRRSALPLVVGVLVVAVLCGGGSWFLVTLPDRMEAAYKESQATELRAVLAGHGVQASSLQVVAFENRGVLTDMQLTPSEVTKLTQGMQLVAHTPTASKRFYRKAEQVIQVARRRFSHPLLSSTAVAIYLRIGQLNTTAGNFAWVVLIHDPKTNRALIVFEFAFG